METVTVNHQLARARSIDEFRSDQDGRRILNMPYYREKPGGVYEFDFIREDTDARKLKAEIENGIIWIIKK
jgi:hypothetical protein